MEIERKEHPDFKLHYANNVRCREFEEDFWFVLPAYVRMTYQGITSLEVSTSSARMNAIIVISVYFGDLPDELVDELENSMSIKINNLFSY